jgi:hypothetical protein
MTKDAHRLQLMQWISSRRVSKRISIAAVVVVLGTGCSSDEDEAFPTACLGAEEQLRAALESAPGPVDLGGTPISGCLVKSSDPGEIQEVGAAYLAVAADLGAAAGVEPEGEAALRLGYLVGAARRGAARTQGIHGELVRRLEQEAARLAGTSDAYARGRRAGERSG